MDSIRREPICTPSEAARSMQTFLWKDHGRVYLYPNPESLASGATEHLVRILRAGLAQAPRFHWVLAGGKTPAACYRQMARETLDWQRLDLSLGDERCLPVDHPERNDTLVRNTLLQAEGPRLARFEPMRAEWGAEAGSAHHARVLETLGSIDLVLLGMGEDGHTASLFPGHASLSSEAPVVPEHAAPKPPPERISLGLTLLQRARHRVFLVTGGSKCAILQALDQGQCLPVGQVGAGDWFIDQDAWFRSE